MSVGLFKLLLRKQDVLQLGIWSGFPDYGFPAYFCHSKHVFQRNEIKSSGKISILSQFNLTTGFPAEFRNQIP